MTTLNLTIRPEFFRLPIRGVDPHFGLSRSYYYDLDKAGRVLLVRLRRRGSQKGVVLVNYEAMSAFLAKAGKSVMNNNPSDAIPPPLVAPTPAAGNVHRLVQRYPEDMELMRKLTPALLHNLLKTISDLEQMVQATAYSSPRV
jgi:hypothetical protein